MRANAYLRKRTTKKGETRYILVIREIGRKEIWKKLGPISRKKAEEIRLRVLNQILNGEFIQEPDVHLYFSEFLEKFIKEFAEGSRSPNTVRVYREQLKPLQIEFQAVRLNEISRQDLERYFAGLNVSGRTKNLRLCALRIYFQKAVQWGYLAKSPTDGIKRYAESSQGSRALTPAELNAIWSGLTTWQKSLIKVMVNSGLRPGEIINLKFQDLDWESGRLIVANDKTRKTKTRKSRFVPMNQELREELEFLKEYLPLHGYQAKSEIGIKDFRPREAHQREFVFCHRDGSKVSCIRLSITRAFKKHGILGVTPHGLRKTFCSLLARQKVHPRVAQQLMGHSKIDMTMRVYTEIDDEQLKEAVNSLSPNQGPKPGRLQVLPGGKD